MHKNKLGLELLKSLGQMSFFKVIRTNASVNKKHSVSEN